MDEINVFENWDGCPLLSIDIVLFTIVDGYLSLVLTKTNNGKSLYNLPGSLTKKGIKLEENFDYILEKRTGITGIYKEQLAAFGDPLRDKDRYSVTIVYMALVPMDCFFKNVDLTKVEILKYKDVDKISLGYDHRDIIKYAKKKLDIGLLHSDIVKHIMPQYFRMSELHKTYEILLGKNIDLRNFQKKILNLGLIKDTGLKDKTIKAPAKLYEFINIENESE